MKDMNKRILVVDLVLKDGRGELKNGVIFDTDDKGIEAINDREYLEAIFNRTAPVWKIQFQNKCINATLMIESFKIKEIPLSEFQ